MRTTEKDLYYSKVVDWKMEDSLLIRVILLGWLTRRQRVQTWDLRLLGVLYRAHSNDT